MNNRDKEENFKEKLIQALSSTERVISEDFVIKKKTGENKISKKFDFLNNLENLNSKNDFIKARARIRFNCSKEKIFKL